MAFRRGGSPIIPADNQAERFAASLAQLGGALGRTLDPDRFKRMEIEEGIATGKIDPSALAAAVRAGGPEALEVIGLDSRDMESRAFAQNLAESFPATFDEMLGRRLARPETVEAAAGAQEAEFEATGEEAETRTKSARLQGNVIDNLFEQNFPQIQARLRVAQVQAERAGFELTDEAIGRYKEFVLTLPEEEQGLAATALTNPNFLQHLQGERELDLRESLLEFRRTAEGDSPFEAMAARYDVMEAMQGEMRDVMKAMREAQEEGNSRDIEALTPQLENVLTMYTTLFPGAQAFIAKKETEGFRGRGRSIEFTAVPPRTVQASVQNRWEENAIKAARVGSGWEEKLEKEAPNFMQGLRETPEAFKEFRRQVNQGRMKLKQQRRESDPRRVGERGLGVPENLPQIPGREGESPEFAPGTIVGTASEAFELLESVGGGS